MTTAEGFDFDVIVVGSGFGGSVTALRLTEKGYKVGVLEAGARFEDDDLPSTSWDLTNYLFRPEVGCYGIQRIDTLKDCMILSGAGVGGGSLVYANTLYEPMPAFYQDPQWRDIADWKTELAPYYDQAKRMLGVVENPLRTPSDDVMQKVAEELGVGETFHPTPVGVFFGGPHQPSHQKVADPYFGGAGPDRNPCKACGECMTGCRHNSKNTLVKNYLYLAEQNGARILPMTTVVKVTPRSADGQGEGYDVHIRFTKSRSRKPRKVLTAQQVVFSASALGTQRLLHKMKDEGHLPGLSDRLGHLSRTNSESILGAIAPDMEVDYSRGVAITSSFHPDEHTHIEPVRYGRGSNAMSFMQTVLTDGDGPTARWKVWLKEMWAERKNVRQLYDVKHWSERTVIALVMQSVDNSITTYTKKVGPFRVLTSKQGHGEPNPTWIPVANQAVRKMAEIMGGTAGGSIGEPFNRPLTAHFIGGCVIANSDADGVVDPWHRVFNHPGLHVVDGSTISANLGVNPSLTITAQAERAMAYWPNKGQADARPPLGTAYAPIEPVAPLHPSVPEAAPGALRLPIVGVS